MSDRISLRWLGTACVHLRWRGAELLFDPYFARARPQGLDALSLILVSHGHFDHCRDAALAARGAPAAGLVAPRATIRWLAREGVAAARLRATEDTPELPWAGGRVRVLASRHIRFDARLVARTLARVVRGRILGELLGLAVRYPMGSNSDFLLELDGERVLFSGSGGGDRERLARLAPTTFLLPFAGRSDAVDYYLTALERLRPRTVVLHHFDDFLPPFSEPYPVAELAARLPHVLPGVRLVVPTVGEWIDL